jgi:nicotinamide-nucleotide amidase
MKASILTIGDEILIGQIVDTNSASIARHLNNAGIVVWERTSVGDQREQITEAVKRAMNQSDVVILTGGLGPTCDDLTKEVVAGAFGIPLELNKAEEDRLRGLYRERGIYMTENHLQQVMLPRGCTVLQNDWGTAPACAFEADGCLVVMLPGPPLECEPLLRYRVRPLLAARGDGIIVSHSVKIFGIGEGTMEYQLRDLMNEMQNPTLAPYAKEGECLVRVTAKAPTEAEAEAMIAPCVARVQRELGAFAYGVDTPNIETCAAELLLAQHKTIAVADSCTGGLLGDLLTNVPGASAVFSGGIIAYNDETKIRLLDVDPALIARCGVVSPEVAAAMADHVRAAFGTDLALSITGLAGPGGDGVHTVGTLFVALATPDGTFHRTLHKDKWGRVRIKHAAANHAFDMVRRYLTGLPVEFEENR